MCFSIFVVISYRYLFSYLWCLCHHIVLFLGHKWSYHQHPICYHFPILTIGYHHFFSVCCLLKCLINSIIIGTGVCAFLVDDYQSHHHLENLQIHSEQHLQYSKLVFQLFWYRPRWLSWFHSYTHLKAHLVFLQRRSYIAWDHQKQGVLSRRSLSFIDDCQQFFFAWSLVNWKVSISDFSISSRFSM